MGLLGMAIKNDMGNNMNIGIETLYKILSKQLEKFKTVWKF